MRFAGSLAACRSPEIQQLLSPPALAGVTIGNFDGMHLGHQALFTALKTDLDQMAQAGKGRPVRVLLTFAPHPRRVFSKKSRVERNCDPQYCALTSICRKVELAGEFGFDLAVVQRFVPSFFSLEAEEFINKFIVDTLHAAVVVVGADWRFGKGGRGSAELLAELGRRRGFKTRIVQDVALGDERLRSSTVRAALAKGDLEQVKKLTSRPFDVTGVVTHGYKRGRQLGFPTANLNLPGQLLPPDGVYACWAYVGDRKLPAAVNVGVRPVFETAGERNVEAYLIDPGTFDLYGQRIRLQFEQYIRPEKKFPSVEDLISAIHADVTAVKEALKG